MRTVIGIVAIVGIIAAVGSLLNRDGGSGKGDLPPVTVAFKTKVDGYTNAGTSLKAATPKKAAVREEAAAIQTMLNEWYQAAFVNVDGFGDGTFPTVAAMFTPDAAVTFTQDIDSLTIGAGRNDVTRVVPSRQSARISVYFEDKSKPTFATAKVTFAAVGTPKQKGRRPIDIEQTAVLHLEKTKDGWRVNYYDAKQTQKERPAPTPTASPS